MPDFIIRLVNEKFESDNGIERFSSVEEAYQAGVAAALSVVADEVRDGKPCSLVEVSIEDMEGELLRRSGVTLSVGALLV